MKSYLLFKNTFLLRMSRVVYFANIFKIATTFIKTTFKRHKKKLKELTSMQCILVFLDITKVADFEWKNPDVMLMSRWCHVCFFWSSKSVLRFITAEYVEDILGSVGGGFLPPYPWATQKRPILNRVKNKFVWVIKFWLYCISYTYRKRRKVLKTKKIVLQ